VSRVSQIVKNEKSQKMTALQYPMGSGSAIDTRRSPRHRQLRFAEKKIVSQGARRTGRLSTGGIVDGSATEPEKIMERDFVRAAWNRTASGGGSGVSLAKKKFWSAASRNPAIPGQMRPRTENRIASPRSFALAVWARTASGGGAGVSLAKKNSGALLRVIRPYPAKCGHDEKVACVASFRSPDTVFGDRSPCNIRADKE
jgi:hypothetical protein